MSKNICLTCGTEYDVCPYCPQANSFVPWRRLYCSIDCFKLFEEIKEYVNGKITKDEIVDYLADKPVEKYKTYPTATGNHVVKIFAPTSKRSRRKTKVENITQE